MIIYNVYDPQTKTYKKVVWSNGLEDLESRKIKPKVLMP